MVRNRRDARIYEQEIVARMNVVAARLEEIQRSNAKGDQGIIPLKGVVAQPTRRGAYQTRGTSAKTREEKRQAKEKLVSKAEAKEIRDRCRKKAKR